MMGSGAPRNDKKRVPRNDGGEGGAMMKKGGARRGMGSFFVAYG